MDWEVSSTLNLQYVLQYAAVVLMRIFYLQSDEHVCDVSTPLKGISDFERLNCLL